MNNDSSISLLNSGGASSSALVATPHILDDEFLEEESNPILLDEEPQPLLQKALSLTIAGKLISQRRPNLANITYSTGRQWGCPDQYEAFELGRGLYSFQFHQEEEKTKVLTGGPWLVDGGLLLVEEVKLNVPIEKTIFAFTKLWVRIHDLPPKGFTEMIGRAVGSALGTFDEADIPRSGAAGNPFNLLRQPNVRKHLRIKIKLNILKPLKRRQVLNLKSEDGTIETYDMRLSYEHLPDLCFCCGIIGHTFSSCSKYTDGNPLPYGEWIRADKFYRLTNAINQGKRPSASTSASKQPTNSCSNNSKPSQVAVSPTKVHNNPTLSKSAPLEATRIPVVSMETSNPTIPTTSIPPNQPTNYTLPVNQYNFVESQINKSLAFPNPNFNPYNIQYLPNHNAWYSPFHSSPLPNLNPTFSPIPSKNLFSNSDIVLPQFSPFPESCEKDPGNNPISPAMTGPRIPAFMGDTATKDNTSTMVDMDFGVVKNTVGQKRKFKAGASKRSNYNNKSNSTSPKKKGKAALQETEISVGSKVDFQKTTFKGRVFMTHATKAIYKLLLSDYVKVSKVSVEDMLFDEQDILRSMEKIEVIDFHQTLEVNGIRFWCYTAGHVLGAAMFMVDIAGVRVLYTGDYSREEDRHLRAAETPQFSPDVCIIESTYGVQLHQPRTVREKRFTDVIHETVSRGGRVLIPAFALGRAQELLLILDEYWSSHPELHNIPIYYASPLAKRCMAVYETYINAMNDRIRNQFASSNPFDFKHISSLKSIENFDDVGPSVVMASPSGLQSGLSRQLFDKWCSDKKNSCVIPGYVVEGTLAKTIINEPKEVQLSNGLTAPLNMHVHYISFSAHADFAQTSTFLKELMPPNIILVHGEANEMGRLKQKLVTLFADGNTKIMTPKNCQSVEMGFNSEKMAKTIGRLAEKTPEVGETVSGLLVKKGFTYQIMAPDDLPVFSELFTANVTQRISVPYSGAFIVIKHRLKQIYESVESPPGGESDTPTLLVHERVTVKQESDKHISILWISDPISDMISDSIVALVLNISREMPKVTVEMEKTEEENAKTTEKVVYSLLVSLFGDVKVDMEGKLVISVDGNVAKLDRQNGEVESENDALKERVKTAFKRIQTAINPIPLSSS